MIFYVYIPTRIVLPTGIDSSLYTNWDRANANILDALDVTKNRSDLKTRACVSPSLPYMASGPAFAMHHDF